MNELIITKGSGRLNQDIEDVVIRIEGELPNILDFSDMYDSNYFFRNQAERLADVLYNSLPIATLTEFAIILAKKLYEAKMREGITEFE